MSGLKILSDEEFNRLNSMPFEELTDDEKKSLNFKILASMPDEQFSHFFNMALDNVLSKKPNATE